MEVDAHAVAEPHVTHSVGEQVVEGPIDGCDFGDDSNGARH
jgi:hypothetical protein